MTNQLSEFINKLYELKLGYKTIINLGYAECKLNNENNKIIELYDKENNKLGEFPIYKYNLSDELINDFIKFIL